MRSSFVKIASFVATLLLTVVIIFGCKRGIKDGNVIDKYWYDSYTYTTLMPIGKTLIPQTHYVAERYCVKIQKVVNKDTLRNEINMHRDEWENTKIGDYINFK